jgi:predicted phage-related endonuclease
VQFHEAFSEVQEMPPLPLPAFLYETAGLLQIKTSSAFNAKEWRTGIPLHYQVQLQHEMLVSEREWATLCVLIDNSRFKVFPDVRRDDEFIKAMLPKLAHFQELIETLTEPPIDDSEATGSALDRMHGIGNTNVVALPDEAAAWDCRLCWVKDEVKRLESESALIKNKFKQVLKANTYGLLPDGTRYSWKQQTKTYTCKACQFQSESAPFAVLRKVK